MNHSDDLSNAFGPLAVAMKNLHELEHTGGFTPSPQNRAMAIGDLRTAHQKFGDAMDRLPSEAALALSADDGGGDDAESSGKAQGEKWKNQQLAARGIE
jgi:hypothetical protein